MIRQCDPIIVLLNFFGELTLDLSFLMSTDSSFGRDGYFYHTVGPHSRSMRAPANDF